MNIKNGADKTIKEPLNFIMVKAIKYSPSTVGFFWKVHAVDKQMVVRIILKKFSNKLKLALLLDIQRSCGFS